MPICPFSPELEAYHDGELPPPRHQAIERHLPQCPVCVSELAELASTSELLASSPRTGLSQIALHRLHRKVDDLMEEGMLRLIRVLSAVAASVLVVGSAWLVRGHQSAVENSAPIAPPWADVAMSSDLETSSGAYSTPAAAWYLADESARP
jgi:anti-sigma factor RsiW